MKTQNGYRLARGGWTCADCRNFCYGTFCNHPKNLNRNGARPVVDVNKVCDLFEPRPRRVFRDKRPGTDTRSPAEYADAQYHGGAGEW